MGIFDEAKNLAEQNSDVVKSGLDQAEQFADEKTGGQYSDQIKQGGDFARDQLGVNSDDAQSQSQVPAQQDQGYSQQDQPQQDQPQQDQGYSQQDQPQQDQGYSQQDQPQQDYQGSQDDQLGSQEQSGF